MTADINGENSNAVDAADLVFVVYGDGSQRLRHSAETQRLVRKQASHAVRTQKASQKYAFTGNTSTDSKPHSMKQSVGKFRLQKGPKQKYAVQEEAERPVLAPLSASQPVPGELGDDAAYILNYYNHHFRQNSKAINVEGDWLSFTMSDVAVSHAQLALIALNMAYDDRVSNKDAWMPSKHASIAIMHVRQSLMNKIPSSPSSAMIGAVALLTIVECLQDDKDHALVHFKGLDSMLSLRGGESVASESKTLARVVAWARRCFYFRWQTSIDMPTLEALKSAVDREEVEKFPELLSLGQRRGLRNWYMYDGLLSPEDVEVLYAFQDIASLVSQKCHSARSFRRQLSFDIYEVEYKLIRLKKKQSNINESTHAPLSVLSRAFLSAAQIYLFLALRQLPRRSSLVSMYAHNLQKQLQECEVSGSGLSGVQQILLLWMHTLHLLASGLDGTAYSKETSAFASLIESMEIQNTYGLTGILRDVAWQDGFGQEELETLWDTLRLNE